ncbi:hypothetical protein [Algoriphagus litoralis]|uniref:hypothetical protein n=1 Tax=Algoriphagus litoralis TaxID=2202829 RepID=UPI000DB9E878|nr:hypothetical protein [Algoriphagus litoralis]
MKKVFPLLISCFLGFTFWSAGMVKLFAGHQFIGWIGPPKLVEQLQEFDLGLFAEFIGVCQITIGFMLLTTRYKLIGGIMMIPMILTILMVTISQKWAGTPYVLGVLFLMDLFILYQYRDFLRPLIEEGKHAKQIKFRSEKTWQGHLTWIAAWALQMVSIPISFENLTLAFLSSAFGVFLGIYSFKVDNFFIPKIPANS